MTGPTVTLDLEHAKSIVRATTVVGYIPELASGLRALADAIETAEVDANLAAVNAALDDIYGTPHAGDTPTGPRWDYVAKATRLIRRIVESDPAYLARADALSAYVRDTFDALGLSLHDEQTLYVAIVSVTLMVEMANNGRKRDVVADETVAAIAKIAQSFTASILDFLPPEARG